jgi:hypothetical protein
MYLWRKTLVMLAFAIGGATLGFLLSYFNARFELVEARYHLKWSLLGFLGGLAVGATGLIIAWRSLGPRGGALAGLCVGVVLGPVAFASTGLLTTPAEVPSLAVLTFGAFLGGLILMRIGLSLGRAMANQ